MPAEAAISMPPGISPDVYGKKDFEAVRAMIHADAGIVLPPAKAMLVYSRLAPLVRKTNSQTFAAYLSSLNDNPEERRRMVTALTTNHTFFYREAHHFEHFESELRPGILKNLANGGKLRIWSAGCSSGEETWSLLMTLLGDNKPEGRRIAQQNVRLLASDLSDNALAKARAGIYETEAIEPVPARLRNNWMEVKNGEAHVGKEMESIARFRYLNLLGQWPMKGRFDIIFCRNVMIYFDEPTKSRLISRYAEQLEPGGYLYIGHSERVSGPAERILRPVGPTIYRKMS